MRCSLAESSQTSDIIHWERPCRPSQSTQMHGELCYMWSAWCYCTTQSVICQTVNLEHHVMSHAGPNSALPPSSDTILGTLQYRTERPHPPAGAAGPSRCNAMMAAHGLPFVRSMLNLDSPSFSCSLHLVPQSYSPELF